MKANKDGGTSVGFSKVTPEGYDGGKNVNRIVFDEATLWGNEDCKHEWVLVGTSTKGIDVGDITYDFRCRTCGEIDPKRDRVDFHIAENIELINKTEWEDIWLKFLEDATIDTRMDYKAFYDWVSQNYSAPEKK